MSYSLASLKASVKEVLRIILAWMISKSLLIMKPVYRETIMMGIMIGYLNPGIQRKNMIKLSLKISSKIKRNVSKDIIALGILLSPILIKPDKISHLDILKSMSKFDKDRIYFDKDKSYSIKALFYKISSKILMIYPIPEFTCIVKELMQTILSVSIQNKKNIYTL